MPACEGDRAGARFVTWPSAGGLFRVVVPRDAGHPSSQHGSFPPARHFSFLAVIERARRQKRNKTSSRVETIFSRSTFSRPRRAPRSLALLLCPLLLQLASVLLDFLSALFLAFFEQHAVSVAFLRITMRISSTKQNEACQKCEFFIKSRLRFGGKPVFSFLQCLCLG